MAKEVTVLGIEGGYLHGVRLEERNGAYECAAAEYSDSIRNGNLLQRCAVIERAVADHKNILRNLNRLMLLLCANASAAIVV